MSYPAALKNFFELCSIGDWSYGCDICTEHGYVSDDEVEKKVQQAIKSGLHFVNYW